MSVDNLFSMHWHRVREVRPSLAADVVISEHIYRGQLSWVLHRRATNDFYRLDLSSYSLVNQLDGKRTVEQIWEQALVERDESAPTQDEWIALLSGLQRAELLLVDRRVSADRLFERREERRVRERRERRLNPLYLRFALFDPDAWLTSLQPLAKALFSRTALVIWLCLITAGILALVVGSASIGQLLQQPSFPTPQLALLMLIIYPLLKLVHELGHALAVKLSGGEVHEIGLVLMVLMPLPYVDASASAAFPKKSARMLVAAAGIFTEMAFAALGAILWVSTSGLVADIGLALLIIGGFSTLLINGNPLLRFDGYYLLADAIEIPNLSSRARQYVLGKIQTLLRGFPENPDNSNDIAERRWLVGYGIAATLYRTLLMLWIAWWLSGQYFLFGVALAFYALVTILIIPLYKGLRAVLRNRSFHTRRPILLITLVPVFLLCIIAWLPLPYANLSHGVVWLPDEAVIRVESGCEITSASVKSGQLVTVGDTLFQCDDPELALRERELIASVDELHTRIAGLATSDPSEFKRLESERIATVEKLADTRQRIVSGFNQASLSGRFDTIGTHQMEGRALARGDVIGYVVPPDQRTIRVALSEHVAARVTSDLKRVELWISQNPEGSKIHSTRVISRTPRASRRVLSAALSTVGGGEHQADPQGNGLQVMRPVFDVELAWPDSAEIAPVGAHVYVRFVHTPMPLGVRLANVVRRAFGERDSA